MIYDLKQIEAEAFSQPMVMMEGYKLQALLAIAERLGVLVEAQKPMTHLVEFEYRGGGTVAINPKTVLEVSVWHQDGFDDCVAIITESCDRSEGEMVIVKGTYAEVMEKLRGEVTK